MIGADDLRKAEDSAKNIDVIGLILSRPVPAFTELTTLAAGITKMPFLKFLFVIIFYKFWGCYCVFWARCSCHI